MSKLHDHYLKVLEGKVKVENLTPMDVVDLAIIGNQTAFDSISHFYFAFEGEYRKEPKNFSNPVSLMMAASDRQSFFANERLFTHCLGKLFYHSDALAEFSLKPKTSSEADTYLAALKCELAEQLPRLVFKNDQNAGLDERLTDEQLYPMTPMAAAFSYGWSHLNGSETDNSERFFKPKYLLNPLICISNHGLEKLKAKNPLGEELLSDANIASTQDWLKMRDDGSFDEFFASFIEEPLERLKLWSGVLTECYQLSTSGVSDRFLKLANINIDWDIRFGTGLPLSYTGKHILGSSMALFDELKDLIDQLAFSPTSFQIAEQFDQAFFSDKIYSYLLEIREASSVSTELGKRYQILNLYKSEYLKNTGRHRISTPFWHLEEWKAIESTKLRDK